MSSVSNDGRPSYCKWEIDQALSTVWQQAERKHQDECFPMNGETCRYCYALTVVADVFPELDASRLEAYRGRDYELERLDREAKAKA